MDVARHNSSEAVTCDFGALQSASPLSCHENLTRK